MDLKDVIKAVTEHEIRLGNIEVMSARVENQIENLVKSLDNLTASIKLMLFGALGLTVGFVIWYIQTK